MQTANNYRERVVQLRARVPCAPRSGGARGRRCFVPYRASTSPDGRTMKLHPTLAAAALAVALASIATAAPLTVQSYATVNGNGQATGGSRNYWDLCYGGVCDKTTENQRLTGATGDLTDGVFTDLNWSSVETVSGRGAYVGWIRTAVPLVSIDFYFAELLDIDEIKIHADDSNGLGGVSLPSRVQVSWSDGLVSFDVVDPPTATPQWLTFSRLGIDGVNSVRVELAHGAGWLFVDEVQFQGRLSSTRTAEPEQVDGRVAEPSSAALGGLGLVGLLAVRRRIHGLQLLSNHSRTD